MKTALITTTINVPRVLALYRKHGEDIRFFVAGDRKTPQEAVDFCLALPNTHYIYPSEQDKWKCSELIGWNCIQRRNIALLEAVKWGAEVILSVDDDNIPLDEDYWFNSQEPFSPDSRLMRKTPFSGLKVSTPSGWFDLGSLLVPPIKQRGFPVGVKSENVFTRWSTPRSG